MGLFNKENKNKFNIDSYFSMVVQNFVNERTIDNYIDVCKVLQYRKFYVCYETTFFDHHLRTELKRSGTLPVEYFDASDKIRAIILSMEIKIDQNKEELLCVFTEPNKIDLRQVNINVIREITLYEVFEKYFSDEKFGGICINSFNEQIMIPYDYIKCIIDNDFDKIKERLSK